jgi:hypothetical protein
LKSSSSHFTKAAAVILQKQQQPEPWQCSQRPQTDYSEIIFYLPFKNGPFPPLLLSSECNKGDSQFQVKSGPSTSLAAPIYARVRVGDTLKPQQFQAGNLPQERASIHITNSWSPFWLPDKSVLTEMNICSTKVYLTS